MAGATRAENTAACLGGQWIGTSGSDVQDRPDDLVPVQQMRDGGFVYPIRSASHSFSFDQRRRVCWPRTAIDSAFRWPTSTTSRLPRVTAV